MITKTANEFMKEAVVLTVPKADLMEREEVEGRIGKRLANAAKQEYMNTGTTALTGAIPGSIAGALYGLPSSLRERNPLPSIVGALGGATLGGGLGYLSARAHNNDIDFAKDRTALFERSPAYRANLYYDAVDDSLTERGANSTYKALSRNERDKQLHSDVFGHQYLRRG